MNGNQGAHATPGVRVVVGNSIVVHISEVVGVTSIRGTQPIVVRANIEFNQFLY